MKKNPILKNAYAKNKQTNKQTENEKNAANMQYSTVSWLL